MNINNYENRSIMKCEIVYYHIAASGWVITGNRIQYMIHEIQ